jgi:SAM-dependent methyltransferase
MDKIVSKAHVMSRQAGHRTIPKAIVKQNVTAAATSRKSRPVVISSAVAAKNLQLVNSIADGLPTTAINGFASLVNFAPSADVPIHRWFRYREGYSVELVKGIISGLPRGSVVLDPFCGCGSTLLAAQELGYESYGFDVNPLSTLVARVKTHPYSKAQVANLKEIRKAVCAISKTAAPDPVPQFDIIDKVFHGEILNALLVSRRFIKSIHVEEIREFVFLAWLSILEDVSNVYKEGNGIKYRNRKRLPDGYITISNEDWQRKIFPDNKHKFVLEKLDTQLSLMLEDLERVDRSEVAKAHVINAPAEQLSDYVPENSVAISVFSPPYCNCFNYFKAFKVELWMGEFVQSYHDLQLLNRSALRSHVETVLSREGDDRIPEVEQFAELLDGEKLWDRRIPNAVRGYFQDMRTIFGELKKVTKPSGKCATLR